MRPINKSHSSPKKTTLKERALKLKQFLKFTRGTKRPQPITTKTSPTDTSQVRKEELTKKQKFIRGTKIAGASLAVAGTLTFGGLKINQVRQQNTARERLFIEQVAHTQNIAKMSEREQKNLYKSCKLLNLNPTNQVHAGIIKKLIWIQEKLKSSDPTISISRILLTAKLGTSEANKTFKITQVNWRLNSTKETIRQYENTLKTSTGLERQRLQRGLDGEIFKEARLKNISFTLNSLERNLTDQELNEFFKAIKPVNRHDLEKLN
ncbi:MAG: hypothetical protein PHQ98_03125 [Candidatus ainarchaeum sp.]|nr:hypothetical protein [Candidatus ainarchaeum sp.]